MAGDDNDFEWDDVPPKLVVAAPEDLVPPTHEWDELEMPVPPVAPTDPLIATFTDLDLAPAREQVGASDSVVTGDAEWVD